MLGVIAVAACAFFVLGAMTDLVTYKIPNWIPLALVALFALAAILAGMPPELAGWHVAVGLGALLFGMALFAFRLIGGGDAKLLAAAGFWMGPAHMAKYCLIFALIGGAFAIALIMLRKAPLPASAARVPVLNQLLQPKAGIPYGVALGLGALFVLPSTWLFVTAFA